MVGLCRRPGTRFHDLFGRPGRRVFVGLITKTNNNPFFAKMKEGAEAKAKELGVELQQLRRQV